MTGEDSPSAGDDPYRLQRFVDAQRDIYQQALGEIREGRKHSHWMWFVFPQLRGLGVSATSQRYAIGSLAEARAYLHHPLLGPRLIECCEAVLASAATAHEIFGSPDDVKLRSCATLFAAAAPGVRVFEQLLMHKFAGQRDARTLALLADDARQ